MKESHEITVRRFSQQAFRRVMDSIHALQSIELRYLSDTRGHFAMRMAIEGISTSEANQLWDMLMNLAEKLPTKEEEA